MKDIFQAITDRIVAQLEAGTAPWVRPWSGEPDPAPINVVTGKRYRGINNLALQIDALSRGYERQRWMTYKQALSLGAHVRRGGAGSTVVFWKINEASSEETHEQAVDDRKVVPILRTYTVFNVAEIDGLPSGPAPALPVVWDGNERAEGLLVSSGARIESGGYEAFYRPSSDLIRLPGRQQFKSAGDYYATALHELTHWTGHEARCARQFGKRFGDDAYAMEELVAELGAAFLCASCRVDGQLQHASYIDHWIKVLKSDKRAVLVAATQAQRAADYVLRLGSLAESESVAA